MLGENGKFHPNTDLSTRWRWMVNTMNQLLYPWGREAEGTQLQSGRVHTLVYHNINYITHT